MRRMLVFWGGVVVSFVYLALAVVAPSRGSMQPSAVTLTPYAYLPCAVKARGNPGTPVEPRFPPDDPLREQALVAEINARRAEQGLAPLTLAPELTQAARRHGRDMADHDFFGHTGSDGSSYAARIKEAGYEGWSVGENLAAGYIDAAAVVQTWMSSPAHKANMLSPVFGDVGASYAWNADSHYRHYWTVTFGARVSIQVGTPGE